MTNLRHRKRSLAIQEQQSPLLPLDCFANAIMNMANTRKIILEPDDGVAHLRY